MKSVVIEGQRSRSPLQQIRFTVLALQQKCTQQRHADALTQVNPAAALAGLCVLQFCLLDKEEGRGEAMLQRGERSQSHHGMNNEYRLPRPCLPAYEFKGASQVCALKGSTVLRYTALKGLSCRVVRRVGGLSPFMSTQMNRAVGPSAQEGAVGEWLGLRQLQAVENREIKK